MIERLNKEAGDEASRKEYCDTEKAETASKREDLKQSIDKSTAQIDKAKAKAAAVKDEVATLQRELATIAEEQGEADQLRQEQKASRSAARADLKQGHAA